VVSTTSTVAVWNWSAPLGWFWNQAPPIISPIQAQSRSAFAEAWMPTTPLPRWTQRSKAVRWDALRMPLPSVLRKTTTSNSARPSSLNSVASSEAVVLKLFASPIAAICA
jgi:hypothetical protein